MRTAQTTQLSAQRESDSEQSGARSTALNITQITTRLWTGGDLPEDCDAAASALDGWRCQGIRHIIDNRMEWCDEEFVADLAPEIRYLHAGVDDAGQRMPDRWFNSVIEFAGESRSLGGGLLVHCHMGINRGPSAAYAVLLHEGWDPIEAIDLIRSARPIAAVGYAEDALDWWQRRNGIDHGERRSERARLARWRACNPHDTIRIIREIRARECTR